jgi:S1-C subfamily serine protease
VNLALPAVVRLATTFQAQLTYFNLDGSSVQFPQGGGSYQITTTGSGAFLSPTGVLLTAYHVVGMTQDEQASLLLQRAAPDIADALNAAHPSQTVTASDIYTQLATTPSAWQATYGQTQTVAYPSLQYTGPVSATSLAQGQSFPVSVLAQSSPDQPTNNDLALLQVSGVKDMPIVPLGDASQVYAGDPLTVLGYPGTADLPSPDGVLVFNNFVTASLENVTVSALKTTSDGSPVIQVDGNLEPGQSGGPALSADGQVVGVVSFGVVNANGTGQTSFLRSVASVRALLQQAKQQQPELHLGPGTFEKRWMAAYDACMSSAAGHWHDAAAQFAALARAYPAFQGVQPYLTYAKAQAAHEPLPNKYLPLLVGAAVVVAVLILVLVVVMVLRRRRRALAARQAQGGAFVGVGPGLNQQMPVP